MSELARRRAAAGLTQQQLADKAGTSQPQIKRLEDGDRKLTKEWASRLAPHLRTTADALLFPEKTRDSLDQMVDDNFPPELAHEAKRLREDLKREIIERRAMIDRLRNPLG